jgi:leucyl-tRNA synthetase
MVSFKVNGHQENISVFTTRPDTILGNLYDISSEHELVTQITADQKEAVQAYIEKTSNDRKRTYGRCKNDMECSLVPMPTSVY